MKEYSENYKTAKALYGYYCTLVKGGRSDDATLLKLLEASGRYEAAKEEYWAVFAEFRAEDMRMRREARKSARTAAAAAKGKDGSGTPAPRKASKPPAPPAPPATEKEEWKPLPLTWD